MDTSTLPPATTLPPANVSPANVSHANVPTTTTNASLAPERASAPTTELTPREFRNAMGRFATGITVVTMLPIAPADSAEPYGITVNAFLSLSLEPPLIGVAIDKRARAHATLMASESFGVSVLGSEQRQVSDRFAGRPVENAPTPFEPLGDFPVVAGALTQLVAQVSQRLDVGDHTLFVGEVQAMRYGDGEPLLYFKGGYR